MEHTPLSCRGNLITRHVAYLRGEASELRLHIPEHPMFAHSCILNWLIFIRLFRRVFSNPSDPGHKRI